MNTDKPSLFGLTNTNRDFSNKDSWGKNQFNSSFPASLCCYLDHLQKKACYIRIDDSNLSIGDIAIQEAFGISPSDDDVYYAFEALHSPFQQFVLGNLPRTDLVIQRKSTGECLAALEVKLTALPDNTTCDLTDDNYGSEIVVRPDTIVYLACSVAKALDKNTKDIVDSDFSISDWTNAEEVLPAVPSIVKAIQNLSKALEEKQKPFLLQPVWKTEGKSPELADNCLDVFIWSDAGFSYFISEIADGSDGVSKITRQTRTAIWLYKMLLDYTKNGKFAHHSIIDQLSYNTKNDKAFASAGNVTNRFMRSKRLSLPEIKKSEIKNIILGGGHKLLSPERRFDAIIFNTPGLFE